MASQAGSSSATFVVAPEVRRAMSSKWSPGVTSTTPLAMLRAPASRSSLSPTQRTDRRSGASRDTGVSFR
jgi:hypothetical protein